MSYVWWKFSKYKKQLSIRNDYLQNHILYVSVLRDQIFPYQILFVVCFLKTSALIMYSDLNKTKKFSEGTKLFNLALEWFIYLI